ncbi:hypothetical protein LX87_05467 [Larkinella arboricola]|uniref:Uncharacterized protein n=1 Tax=Larkinella arboricola TaxID=643671 RepID=A0A327WHS4_LARAB|nr:hypothetical protein [Larkinella arboricola]RAJ90838.1 hypothetical protein LX87_05467 [Larkinella arboricola]
MKALLLLLLFTSVTVSYRKTVFEPDLTDPRLPAYTQKGNQVGGAFINGVAWQTYYSGPQGVNPPKDAL